MKFLVNVSSGCTGGSAPKSVSVGCITKVRGWIVVAHQVVVGKGIAQSQGC